MKKFFYINKQQIVLINKSSLSLNILGKQKFFYVFTDINQKKNWKFLSKKTRQLLSKSSLIAFKQKFKWK